MDPVVGERPYRLIVGISGASGVIYGIRLLEVLARVAGVETHLILTAAARQTIPIETDWGVDEVERMAEVVHRPGDIAASISSGSFPIDAMVIAPCSMGSLSAVAHSSSDNLLERAADVTLQERRPLVLVPRESPLHLGHLRLLVGVAEIGAVVCPPMPAFDNRPTHLTDIIDHTVSRIIDLLAIDIARPWAPRSSGPKRDPPTDRAADRPFPDCPRTDLVEARRPRHVGPR